jgi:hypothetical protein
MEGQETVFARGAKIVGVAGLVAGVVGGLAGRALQDRQQATMQDRLQRALDDLTKDGSARQSLASAVSDVAESARSDFEGAIKASRQRRKRVEKKQAELKASGMAFGDYMRLAMKDGAERIGESLQEALGQTSESLKPYAEDLAGTSKKAKKQRKKARKQARAASKGLEARASEGRKNLMKLRKDARRTSEDRLHKLEEIGQETLDKRLKPSLEKAGAAAAVIAAEARKRFEEEAKELEKRYEQTRPKLEKSAEHYGERASELREELRKLADERAKDAERLLQEGAVQARHLAHDASEGAKIGAVHAREVAHDAGESAKEGGKNAGSLLLWLTIAGGVIYQVFLNDDQKRKARELASSAFHEGMAIYQDMRGENAEFTA